MPLSDFAIEELMALRREAETSAYVLPEHREPKRAADPKLLTRNLARARKRFTKLGIQTFNLHDLRRTCRTGLARLKVEPHVAERVLNHAQDRIPGTYDVHDYLCLSRASVRSI